MGNKQRLAKLQTKIRNLAEELSYNPSKAKANLLRNLRIAETVLINKIRNNLY